MSPKFPKSISYKTVLREKVLLLGLFSTRQQDSATAVNVCGIGHKFET